LLPDVKAPLAGYECATTLPSALRVHGPRNRFIDSPGLPSGGSVAAQPGEGPSFVPPGFDHSENTSTDTTKGTRIYTSKPIEDILHQVNQTLAPSERVNPEQIRDVGPQLDRLLPEARGRGWQSEPAPILELTFKQRLRLFWQATKEKLTAWLRPICPRWRKVISRLKQFLQQVSKRTGQDIPGTGKSPTAKATASVLGVPLLKLDAGPLFAGLVGQSESNLRSVIQMAEAIGPAVLWINEIEKGFAGTKSSVFGVATANNISQLPPEMVRKERFDELFFVDLPNQAEREAI
jgi:hypothetical protein